jgi:hypothetical protein
MKTVSGMGRFPMTIKLKNEAEQCGICHFFHHPLNNLTNNMEVERDGNSCFIPGS